jgi:hypothetical protein
LYIVSIIPFAVDSVFLKARIAAEKEVILLVESETIYETREIKAA